MQSNVNKESQLAKCPYNQNHIMPKERLLWHLSSGCKDKVNLENNLAKSEKLGNVWPSLCNLYT